MPLGMCDRGGFDGQLTNVLRFVLCADHYTSFLSCIEGTLMLRLIRPAVGTVLLFLVAPHTFAVSPATVMEGKILFEQEWPFRPPMLGSDGLGPLFNGASCVACHNQGGVGGGGAAEFNAKTIGIHKIQITGGVVTNDSLSALVRSFHPGFVLPDGTMINTCSVTHHGGSPAYQAARSMVLDQLPAEFSSNGGPVNAAEVRRANAYPILFQNRMGNLAITINASLFQRNTTALFGAGLLDEVTDKQIREQVKIQKRHPEISGRPSVLRSGRLGKFGWRANLASLVQFTDQACANEVGLKTKRRGQPNDPMNPSYQNPGKDISDQQVRAMRDFTAALPAPSRRMPSDSYERALAVRGQQVFSSIGCAVCHVPNLGPAAGAYTDLLLHEMGRESMDLNHAEPYILRTTPVTNYGTEMVSQSLDGRVMTGSYYGSASTFRAIDRDVSDLFAGTTFKRKRGPNTIYGNRSLGRPLRRERPASRARREGFAFVAPSVPLQLLAVIPRGSDEMNFKTTEKMNQINVEGGALVGDGMRVNRLNGDFTRTNNMKVVANNWLRVHFERTRFNEEWRTPPLWGVADSAPYMHDGRAETLLESITIHGGESEMTRDRFLNLSKQDRDAVILFLKTMVAPVSNLQARL